MSAIRPVAPTVVATPAPANVNPPSPVVKYKATEAVCSLVAYTAFLGTSFTAISGLSAFTITSLSILPPNPGTTVGLFTGLGTGFVAGIKIGVHVNNTVDESLLRFCQSIGL